MKTNSTKLNLFIILTLLQFIFVSVLLAQNSIHVDVNNTNSSPDGTTGNPFQAIQDAIASASSGDTVKVATGTYDGNVLIQEMEIILYGGYNNSFSSRADDASLTTIQGDGTNSTVNLNSAAASVVDGFRITGGTRSTLDEFGDFGGGFFCIEGSPTISNNIIEDNDAHPPVASGNEVRGGGIYSSDAGIKILNNVIRNNLAGTGAGININGGSAIIRGNSVSDNDIFENEVGRILDFGWGGGIVITDEGNNAVIRNNRIMANSAPTEGSGIFIDEGASAILQNNLIANNACTQDGGAGIYVDGAGSGDPGDPGSTATIINCTVVQNFCTTSVGGGNGVEVEGNSQVTVENSIFWGNGGDDFFVDGSSQLTVTFCNSEESIQGGGNFQGNPLFANEDDADFHLQSTGGRWDPLANAGSGAFVADAADSPCLDAGNPATEFANEASPNGGRVNLGWYGNTAEASKSPGITSVEQNSSLPETFALYQNFPNPFNPTTNISFQLSERSNIKLKLFDLLGREIANLVSGTLEAGTHDVAFNAQHLQSGVYFYRIEVNSIAGHSFVQTKKLTLLK